MRITSRATARLAFLALAMAACSATAASPTAAPNGALYLTIDQLRTLYGDAQGRIAVIQGVEIYYKDEGPQDAPVLLMVHGSASSLRTWDKIADALKTRYRIVRYDVPGMGLSGRISDQAAATVSPVQIAKGLLDKLRIDHVDFLGVSSGGTLGMYLAAEHPGLVRRLILSNTPADRVIYDHMVQPQSFIDAKEEAERAGGYKSQNFWNEYLSYFSGRPERLSHQKRQEYFDFNRRIPEKHPISLVARIDDGVEATRRMKMVTAPTLLVWGGSDKLLTLPAMNSLERHLANAQVSKIVMPDVGHYPPIEAPERFTRILEVFLEAAAPDLTNAPEIFGSRFGQSGN